MRRLIRPTAIAAVVPAVIGGLALTAAAPAQAATAERCSTASSTVNLPNKPDVTITARICIDRVKVSGSSRTYKATVKSFRWDGTSIYTGGTRFDKATVQAVVVDRYNRLGKRGSVNVTSALNNNESGSRTNLVSATLTTSRTTWKAGFFLYADIDGDGKGQQLPMYFYTGTVV
jgi:hypothetical protein